MPLYPDSILISYSPVNKHFSATNDSIIATLTRSAHCKMDIRHEYHITIAHVRNHVKHTTTPKRYDIVMQSLRVCFVKIHDNRITFRWVVILRQI